MASSRRAPRHDVSRLQILRQRPPHGGRWRTACGFLIHLSDSQIFKQPNHKQKPIRASCRQNIITRLATRCARVVEKPSALGLVRPRRGRAGCRVPDAPAALCAKRVARPRTSILSGGTGKPGNPARNGFTDYTVLSSGRCSLRPSSRGLRFCPARLGGLASAGLDPSIRGGTTRLFSPLRYRSSCATFISSQAQLNGRLPCQLRSRPIPPRPSHLIPRFVTIAIRPS
jgi:hypothetical protein